MGLCDLDGYVEIGSLPIGKPDLALKTHLTPSDVTAGYPWHSPTVQSSRQTLSPIIGSVKALLNRIKAPWVERISSQTWVGTHT